jgi:hypothetical protein
MKHALAVESAKKSARTASLIECGACQLNCAGDAIEVTKGTGCLFVIIKEDILKMDSRECGCA